MGLVWYRRNRPTNYAPLGGGGGGGDLASKPLLSIADFTRVGAFRFTTWSDPPDPYKIGQVCAFNPTGGLFLIGGTGTAGGVNRTRAMECEIPGTLSGPNESVWTNLPLANMLQDKAEITEGNWNSQVAYAGDFFRHGGLLVHNGRLIGSGLSYYDATHGTSGTPRYSQFARSKTLATPSFEGWKAVWDAQWTGYSFGDMCPIPDYAQVAFGGYPVMSGGTAVSIIARLSWGPSIVAWNPDDITGTTNSVIAGTPYLYYTSPNPLDSVVGQYAPGGVDHPDAFATDASDLWTRATQITGIYFPEGSRSIIFTGVQGTGDYCYGEGNSNPALHNTSNGLGFPYCLQPYGTPFEGEHAAPYRPQMWCYDAQEVLANHVLGTPWLTLPYEYGGFTLPIDVGANNQNPVLGSLGKDPSTKRMFLPQIGAGPGVFNAAIWVMTHP